MKNFRKILLTAVIGVVTLSTACSAGGGETEKSLTGIVKADGSSTVGPITQAVAEEFNNEYRDVQITVGISGTGGGFKKFVVGEIDIADASRKAKQEEIDQAKTNGIEMTEFEVAYDGIAIVVNKENIWATDMTTEELKKMWQLDSTAKLWSDIRAEWPNEPIKFYSPGTDSGTFEYFTEAINGSKKKEIRQDGLTTSEDDNTLVTGVAGDKYAIGYFGLAYYEENADKLNIVKVNGITPSVETVKDKTYKPLSRPLFIYVNNKSLEREEMKTFIQYYLENVKELVRDVGYIPLEDEKYTEALNKLK
ncbi:MAG: PstS family phosphate transporter substrate-binding protein [Clostridiales bacterium]|jgi:phosphate transport system substrate-binding protein|nr:PstS family phosphate transporter substrate-binding protein [Clostridiales bacterium]